MGHYTRGAMGLRVCLVTPFAWSRPHDVNEHVAGIARELRTLGHEVTVLAPSTRAADLLAGRRALLDGTGQDVIALGPAVPVSRRSRIGVPVGVRANPSPAPARGGGGTPPPLTPGVDTELFRPRRKRQVVVYEWRPTERALARAVARALRALPDWELVLLRTKPLAGRPTVSRALRGRAHVRTLRDGAARAPLLNEASIFVPAFDGLARVSLEAAAAGAAIVSPPEVRRQPELAAAEIARLAEDAGFRERSGTRARARTQGQSFEALARDLDEVYRSLTADAMRPRPT